MASSKLKKTRKAVAKTAKGTAIVKTAKGAGKTVTKSAQYAAAAKVAKGALSKAGDRTRTTGFLAVGATTAAAAYLFGGNSRRRRARLTAPFRRSGRGDLNDPALARKVESEIFRPADAPKSDVSVNVEYGVVFLRGQVRDDAQAKALEKAARSVKGVKDVQNLLHAPGEPAPAKTESHDHVERPVSGS
jgi:osmotically-inducible protein OsmY